MKSLKVNFALNLSNQILGIVVPFITTPYIARIFGAEKLGAFSYANSIAYYFALFGILGISNYGGREIAKVRYDQEKLNEKFSGIYATQLFSTSLVIVFYILYIAAENDLMSKIFLGNIVAVAFDINWFYYGLEKFDVILMRSFFVKIISVISIFMFIKNANDLYLYAIIIVTGSFFGNLLLWLSMRRKVSFVKPAFNELKNHLKKNIILFMPIVLTSVYRVMDRIMLKWLGNFAEVGFYDCADKIGQIPLYFFSALSQILIPRISFLISQKFVDTNYSYLNKSIAFVSLISTTIIFGSIGIADIFVPVYFGIGYERCIGLIKVLLPSYIFTGYASVIRAQLLIPYKKDREFIISLAVGAIINFILNILLIPYYGANGAAFATSVTEIVVCIITFYYSRDKMRNLKFLKYNGLFYFSGFVMLIVLNLKVVRENDIKSLLLEVVLGAAVYCIAFGFAMLFGRLKKRKN